MSRPSPTWLSSFVFTGVLVIVVGIFAATYRLLDRLTATPQFLINGVAKEITFADSLYFSIVTLATVGYGDITLATSLVRLLAGIEVLAGLVLLLFGFNEIMRYTRPRERSRP